MHNGPSEMSLKENFSPKKNSIYCSKVESAEAFSTLLMVCSVTVFRILILRSLGTVQTLFCNMADAKRNGATTFFELVHNCVNTFY